MEDQTKKSFLKQISKGFSATYAENFLKSLDSEDAQLIESLANDEVFCTDLGNIFIYFKVNFDEEDISNFLISFSKNVENAISEFPSIQNEKAIINFISLVSKIYEQNTISRFKIISRGEVVNKFNVDNSTFNNWLKYFHLDKYIGIRKFNSKEYQEIQKALIYVKGLKIEDLSPYHFESFNKEKIADIIFKTSSSSKSKYRKLLSKREEIDDLNPHNYKFLDWISTHHIIPFSIAFQFIELLTEKKFEDDNEIIFEVFKNYFEITQ